MTPTAIYPSVIAADMGDLRGALQRTAAAGADGFHVDVMDGVFVPTITLGPLAVSALRRATSLPLDVHLMIVHPERHVAAFAEAGADGITVHWEACVHAHRILQEIRSRGGRAGIAVNPGTPLCALEEVLPMVDLVLVMGVNPGFSGQKMIPECVAKTAALSRRRSERALDFKIEFDGGVTMDNIGSLRAAGCDIAVAGSAVFDAADPAAALRRLKAI
jgi:ribulose-phosphate 3-epimerase